jgi:hypothetical protein
LYREAEEWEVDSSVLSKKEPEPEPEPEKEPV